MRPVSSIVDLFARHAGVLTVPTRENLSVLLRGALLAPGARTVTGCLRAAWPWAEKDWRTYENVPRRARVPIRALARESFHMALELVPPDAVVELAVDETLVRRYGPHVVGVGMHRDAVRSSHSQHLVTPGHKWVVVSMVVRLPSVHRALALPIASALYTAKKKAPRSRTEPLRPKHRTVGEIARVLVRMIARWAPQRRLRVLGDGLYGSHDLADAFNPRSPVEELRRVTLVSRFKRDAALYAPPPPYKGSGRPSVKGKKLPAPRQTAMDPATHWDRLSVAWYGAKRKTIDACSGTGLWYRCGSAATEVRWVLARDPKGEKKDEVFFSTDTSLTPQEIVEAFVRRWAMETTFQEARDLLGLETLRNRAETSVRRSVPMLLSVYTLVVVWFAKTVEEPEQWKQEAPWYKKPSLTFSDMLVAAREDVLNEILLPRTLPDVDDSKAAPPVRVVLYPASVPRIRRA